VGIVPRPSEVTGAQCEEPVLVGIVPRPSEVTGAQSSPPCNFYMFCEVFCSERLFLISCCLFSWSKGTCKNFEIKNLHKFPGLQYSIIKEF
jgi:hypothetical protein